MSVLGLGTGLIYPNLMGGDVFIPNGLSSLFDGSDDRADVAHYTGLTPGANSASGFSVSIWFNTNHSLLDDLKQDKIISKAGSAGNEWAMVIDSQLRPRFFLYFDNDTSNRYRIFMSSTISSVGAWNHIVFTWDATIATNDTSAVVMYLNGVRGDASSGATVNAPSSTGLVVDEGSASVNLTTQNDGAGTGAQTRYKGFIDEVSIFNATLTDAAVAEAYNSGCPIDMRTSTFGSNLQGYWRMGEGDGVDGDADATITNLSSASGAEDMTLVNGAEISSTTYAGVGIC